MKGDDGGEPSADEIAVLARQVQLLDDEVVGIISSITGAPSISSFRQGNHQLINNDQGHIDYYFSKCTGSSSPNSYEFSIFDVFNYSHERIFHCRIRNVRTAGS